jgi:hypothetical protein
MRPWSPASAISLAANTVVANAKSLYRFGRDTPSDTQYWMTWATDVDVVRGLVGTDTTERTYFTGTSEPKWIDNTFALAATPYPSATRTLGVPPPATAVTVNASGGTSTSKEQRAYVWTWVTDKLEESAPGPASSVTALTPADATWQITFNETVPTPGAGQNWVITKRRLYRSAVTSTGSANYQLVAEITNLASGYVFTDTVAGTSLGYPIQSLYWTMPPSNLVGLTAMWNGMLAGFVDKTLYISEQFVPYAWPGKYTQIVNDTIVGLSVWQQNMLIHTTGRPYLLTGSDPQSISLQPIDGSFATSAKRAIREIPGGIVWAAPEGLAYYGSRGSGITTADIFTKEQWAALVPGSMVIAFWSGFLIVSYDQGSGRTCMVFDWNEAITAAGSGVPRMQSAYGCTVQFDTAWQDPLSGELYLLNKAAGTISKWNTPGSYLTASFTSKVFRQAKQTNFQWLQALASAYPVTVTVVADGTTVTTRTLTDSKPVKLPAGFKARDWQVTVGAYGQVQEVILSTDLAEIQKTQ